MVHSLSFVLSRLFPPSLSLDLMAFCSKCCIDLAFLFECRERNKIHRSRNYSPFIFSTFPRSGRFFLGLVGVLGGGFANKCVVSVGNHCFFKLVPPAVLLFIGFCWGWGVFWGRGWFRDLGCCGGICLGGGVFVGGVLFFGGGVRWLGFPLLGEATLPPSKGRGQCSGSKFLTVEVTSSPS